MRYPPNEDPRSDHSVRRTVAATVLTALLAPALVLFVSYPVTATGVAALGLAGLFAAKTAQRFRRTRRRENRTRNVCVDRIGVCVEV
ncbi:hypothetical protein M0R89_02725 [Halorussus limi]|uniref:Uncharacterized protein n=1 Tax=Halorussus limi TaxID=2938695 RepID=A0A8U0HVV9_9EURY|nr:hypothetical protein [Halorussus limi]UPV74989.1 hypothetical protein M0R89_02725 [Halorussus limi]